MIDNYNSLTIKKYLDIKEVLEMNTEEIDKQVSLIAILADMDENDVYNLPLPEFQELNEKTAFLNELPQTRNYPKTKYKLGGLELETVLDMRDVTAGQYIDYQTFVKDSDKYLVELLSVFLVPKGKKYNDGYDILEVQNAIRENLSIVEAISMSAFFLMLCESLIKATVQSSIKKLKRMMRKEKDKKVKAEYQKAITALEQSGAGLR